jgi:hypothetical protein
MLFAALARCQRRDMRASDVQFALQAALHFMTCKGLFNCAKKVVRCYGLGQKIIRTRFDGSHRGGDIGMPSEEYDRQRRTEFAQAPLQLRTAQSSWSGRRSTSIFRCSTQTLSRADAAVEFSMTKQASRPRAAGRPIVKWH